MKKVWLNIIVLLFFGTSLVAVAANFPLNIYEKPESSAKVVASIPSGKQVIVYPEKNGWIRVVNPENGDAGWAKANELTGPVIITKINGVETRQQVIANKNSKERQPQVYSVIQYSSSQNFKSEDAQKIVREMEERSKRMNESMQRVQKYMQNAVAEMFKEFKNFPMPVIVISEPDKDRDSKTDKGKK